MRHVSFYLQLTNSSSMKNVTAWQTIIIWLMPKVSWFSGNRTQISLLFFFTNGSFFIINSKLAGKEREGGEGPSQCSLLRSSSKQIHMVKDIIFAATISHPSMLQYINYCACITKIPFWLEKLSVGWSLRINTACPSPKIIFFWLKFNKKVT